MKTETIILIYGDTQNHDANLIAPMSLLYIATPLKGEFRIVIVDQRTDPDWRSTLRDELNASSVTCVGISSMTGPQIARGLEAARIVRQTSPSTPIVWGGVHPSLLPEETMASEWVDMVVVGDGEVTFKELAAVLRDGGDKSGVKGILYKEGDSIVRTPPREPFAIDTMGPLAYDLIDMDRYKSAPAMTDKASLPLITSRGCPWECAYCYNTRFSGRRWSCLSPETTVEWIQDLVRRYHVSGIFLLDDNFFVDVHRVRRICERLLERNVGIRIYNANCRADALARMDDDLLSLMKRAGFDQLFIGVESGSDEVLRRIRKNITADQVVEANARLRKADIRPFFSFMAGFPFESIDDIKKTLLLMRRLIRQNPAAIAYRLQFFTPFPGTELYDLVRDMGMDLPESLEQWAEYHYNRINCDGIDARRKRFLTDFQYYTTFLDKKLSSDRSHFIRLVARVYSELLEFRLRHGYYACRLELAPVRIGRRILRSISHTC